MFQGRYMREDATLVDKLFYSYAYPLMKSSMTEEVVFEQYGDLPDRLRIVHEERLIEQRIRHYIARDP